MGLDFDMVFFKVLLGWCRVDRVQFIPPIYDHFT